MFTQHQVAKILVAENQSLWQELSFFKFQFVRRTKDFVQIENQGLGKEDTGLPTKDDTSKMIVRNLASNIIEIQRIEIARYSNIRWISLHSEFLEGQNWFIFVLNHLVHFLTFRVPCRPKLVYICSFSHFLTFRQASNRADAELQPSSVRGGEDFTCTCTCT